MKKLQKIILTVVVVGLLLLNISAIKKDNPIFVFSSVRFDSENSGILIPEFVADANGSWRGASINDLWLNQEFSIYERDNISKLVGKITIKAIKEEYGLIEGKNSVYKDRYFWAIYSSGYKFKNIAIEKSIFPTKVNDKAQKEFERNDKIAIILNNVIKYDLNDINEDFKEKISPNIIEFMVGDINGDKHEDFILIIGGENFRQPNSSDAVVIGYFSENGIYKRIPIAFWKNPSDENGWPRLLFIKDLNGDGAGEIVISDSNSDTNIPIIFSWSKDKGVLEKIYHGKIEFWNG